MDARFWDDKYESRDQLFSGAPNPVLVTETAGLPPGQALDVGCGEGADALWLARSGWLVTAIDISRVALRRAAASAETGGRVAWAVADLTTIAPPSRSFDLVSVQYFPLPHQAGHTALSGLLAAVTPGGTFLFASHDLAELEPHNEQGPDPRDYYHPADVAGLLGEDWTILVNETRPRIGPAPKGTHHTRDTVLRAQRTR